MSVTSADLWSIRISQAFPFLEELKEVLIPAELKTFQRFHQVKDQHKFLIRRAILRILLGKYLSLSPSLIKFSTAQNKRPVLDHEDQSLNYNVSHSGDRILIAISNSGIGADIEHVQKEYQYRDVLEYSFSRDEIRYIEESKDPLKNFYCLWTRKEALIKACSKGIDDDLPAIPSLDGSHAVTTEMIGDPNSWTVNSFEVAKEYMGSTASSMAHIPDFYDVPVNKILKSCNFNKRI
ncbi:MAG: 4'-phosphopantetheinyl transferase family protein [Daejeonella sp.]